ncbi:MAG: ROK family protein [Acidobacteriota bacterium]
MTLWGGVEAGGTKFVCAVGTGPDDLRAEARFATTRPGETLARTVDFFRAAVREHGELDGLGIATFGPADVDPKSPTWGHITTTPKAGWAGTDVAGTLGRELGVPVAFDTDVNGAALGEQRWGAALGLDSCVYVTIGTGIGGGGLVAGELMHGLLHPEMGHINVPRHPEDTFEGLCPFHGDCLEGLASGPAIEARTGTPGGELADDHPVWDIEAHYLTALASNLTLILSPQRLIFGGGVMQRSRLYELVRRGLRRSLAGYLQVPEITEHMDRYLVAPRLGARAGVCGAIALASRARTSL